MKGLGGEGQEEREVAEQEVDEREREREEGQREVMEQEVVEEEEGTSIPRQRRMSFGEGRVQVLSEGEGEERGVKEIEEEVMTDCKRETGKR